MSLSEIQVTLKSLQPILKQVDTKKFFQQIMRTVLILLTVALLTLFGLYMAQQGLQGQPVEAAGAVTAVITQLGDYVFDHPQNYVWHKEIIPAGDLVWSLFFKSAGLLMISLAVAGTVGVWLGIQAALSRKRGNASLIVISSILGISTPSFLLAMLLWMLNLTIMRLSGAEKSPLPATGFGWDSHLVLPALVLAARPLAQIMQVTYIAMSDVLEQDYMRAAKARGGSQRYLINQHALRNILIPVLTTMGTSLRFSLASLPVVESFFLWPGLGLGILEAIQLDMIPLITDLTLSLGLLFLLMNSGLELLYPLIDPRMRGDSNSEAPTDQIRFREQMEIILLNLMISLRRVSEQLKNIFKPALHSRKALKKTSVSDEQRQAKRRHILRSALHSPAMLLGLAGLFGLATLTLFGGQLAGADPYTTHNIMMIDKVVFGPPFAPSHVFPWGSDQLGRDMQALVLNGVRQTLTLALLGMCARVLLGVILGMLAGWWQNSWIDRLISALTAVWAAFPVTIFAMIFILGMGIQRGMSVFIIALCLVGWGEITQYVRGLVISQKPMLYIEAARSIGASPTEILYRHIFPHLVSGVLVASMLEMGSILMLLAELGYLNIFLGGGFRVDLLGQSNFTFSDVPELGALLSNIRGWWRSYPWMAWYPGLFFFLMILTFNVFGEGLRKFIEESKINLNRFINRYTLLAALVLVAGVAWALRTSAPVEVYRPQAQQFDAQRALKDIQRLASSDMQGRETGTPGAEKAALYIAARMDEIGLFPAGQKDTFIQTLSSPSYVLSQTPRLTITDANGHPLETPVYHQDYVEYLLLGPNFSEGQGALAGLAVGNGPADIKIADPNFNLFNKIVIVRMEDLDHFRSTTMNGMLIISDDPLMMQKRLLSPFYGRATFPVMLITPALADRLLATAGSSLAELDNLRASLPPDQMRLTKNGAQAALSIPEFSWDADVRTYTISGYIPGSGAEMGQRKGEGLDNQVIIVSAYFDGSGFEPDGTLYPGANDNASGVATLLEVARVLKEGVFQPEKTVMFVAWSGGERFQGLNVSNTMNAKTGFNALKVEAVIELSGLGAGSGNKIMVGQGSSFRLMNIIEDAAGRVGVGVTNRGRDTHFGLPQGVDRGGRSALTVYLSWEGSDALAHTPQDTPEIIDLQKLQKSGELTSLLVTVLSREVDY